MHNTKTEINVHQNLKLIPHFQKIIHGTIAHLSSKSIMSTK